MRLDLGIASYQNPSKLDETIRKIKEHSQSDWRLLIVDNASPDPEVRAVIEKHAADEPRIVPRFKEENTGYVGAVNEILAWAETNYLGYVDNDAYIQTPGWDTTMLSVLERHRDVAMVFPNGGAYEIERGGFTEILWGIGCCWLLNVVAFHEVGYFDTELGHQEEVDYQTRLRLAGWKMAAAKNVRVIHEGASSANPEAQARISQGVIRWVDKWNQRLCGKDQSYHSPNVLRFEDWHPNALYLEEWYQLRIPGLNANPEVITIDGREYDLIKVPRYKNYYRDRII
jgi:GT2 family glycosyltransferase